MNNNEPQVPESPPWFDLAQDEAWKEGWMDGYRAGAKSERHLRLALQAIKESGPTSVNILKGLAELALNMPDV